MGNEENKSAGIKDNWQWPWGRKPVNVALASWQKKIEEVNSFLAEAGSGYTIDEIALQFESRHLYNIWLNEAVRGDGVEIFNSADDHVRVEPFGSEYDVQYTFLRMPIPDVRLEAMFIKSGVSPLHMGHAAQVPNVLDGQQPIVVHMSFKVDSPHAYGLACAEMEALGGVLGQSCFSDYGKFSYFKFPAKDFAGIWIKPRINMRAWRESQPNNAIKPGEIHGYLQRSHLRAINEENGL